MAPAVTVAIEKVLAAVPDARRKLDGWYLGTCPAHPDTHPSLGFKEMDDGWVAFKCRSRGCSRSEILDGLGLTVADTGPERPQAPVRNGHSPAVRQARSYTCQYQIRGVAGELVAIHHRAEYADGRKRFTWSRPDGQPGLNGTPVASLPLYRAETLRELSAAAPVVLVEGEKAAGRLASMLGARAGVLATVTGAATIPEDAVLGTIADRRVVLWSDNDAVGGQHMDRIAERLQALGCQPVKMVDWPDAPEHGDAADYLASHDRAEVLALLKAAAPWEPKELSHSETRATVPPPAISPPALSSDPDILGKFAVAIRGGGLVGEVATAKLTYLVLTSRLLDKPVSLGVKGLSSSGKSFVVESTLRFFPPSAYIARTAMSSRALIYTDESFRHRVLVLFEVDAMREGNEEDPTAYIIRTLLSEGRIDYEVTVRSKDKGFTTRHIVKEGPTGLVFTTTKDQIHGENETRVLSVTSDDTAEQTRKILASMAVEGAGRGPDLQPWIALQSWLQTAEHRVTIPFAEALAKEVPAAAVRLRRDFRAVLGLIQCSAILHQQTRVRDTEGRIVATLEEDYEVVRELVAPLISEGVGRTVSEATREAVEAVIVLGVGQPDGVTATALAAALELDKSAARRRLLVASRGGWVVNKEDQRGKPGRWAAGEPLPTVEDVLPVVARLQAVAEAKTASATAQTADLISERLSGGTVARDCDRSNARAASLPLEALASGRNVVGWNP